MSAESPMLEITDLILEAGGKDLLQCMQCATCTAVCPWPMVKRFSARAVIRLASLGLEGYEEDDLWNCVTCNTCVQRCPRGLDIVEIMRSARAVLLESGTAPATYRGPLAGLRSDGNPWQGERAERYAWAEGLDLRPYDDACDYLYFTCCTQAYDPRNRKVARALVTALRRGGLTLGVLGERESCCGDQARKVGAEDVYQQLRQRNVALLQERAVKRVLVSSPHCRQVMNLDYARDLGIVADHYSQVLAALLDAGELTPLVPVDLKVTYHDPCYLGRHAGEYEAPRRVLRAIPGLDLLEMPRNRDQSLCCGGGGGGLWLDVPQDQRFAIKRVQEAEQTGAQVIATACPYCTSMLEDAVKVLDLEERLAVKDVAELLSQSLAERGA